MLANYYRTCIRMRNRRIFRTIIYSCAAGAPVWYTGSWVHGFLVSAVVTLATLYYYTNQLERCKRASSIGEPSQ